MADLERQTRRAVMRVRWAKWRWHPAAWSAAAAVVCVAAVVALAMWRVDGNVAMAIDVMAGIVTIFGGATVVIFLWQLMGGPSRRERLAEMEADLASLRLHAGKGAAIEDGLAELDEMIAEYKAAVAAGTATEADLDLVTHRHGMLKAELEIAEAAYRRDHPDDDDAS